MRQPAARNEFNPGRIQAFLTTDFFFFFVEGTSSLLQWALKQPRFREAHTAARLQAGRVQ
jgi:hypothetical protein